MRPSFIGHYTEFLDDDNASYPGSDELLSIGSAVGKNLGLIKMGIHIETVLPGRRTSYPHAESEEEEFAFVIEGHPHVWINGELFALRPGDFVAFPSGTGIAHTFINNASYPAKLLVGGEVRKATNRIIYPLNDEMNLIKKTHETYWDDHPKHHLGPHNGLPDRPSNVKWNLPVLETPRLILRAVELSDAPSIFEYASDPEVTKYVAWETHTTLEESVKVITNVLHPNCLAGGMTYAICLKENPSVMIGDVSAMQSSRPHKIIELGTVLHRNYWGRGIVVEAFERLIKHCWDTQDVVRIQSRCFKENRQSFRMMEKLGMKHEGLIRQSFFCKNKSWDMEMFALTRS